MAIAIAAYPWPDTIFPGLLLLRLLFATGAAAASVMVTAVLADYIDDRHKGKVSGKHSRLNCLLLKFVI